MMNQFSEKKNVVMIVADELNKLCLGCYGHDLVKTPNIDRIAEMGMRFEEAYCATPLCTPSRVSMFTGQYPCTHGRFFVDEPSHIGEEVPTLVSHLKEKGYTTALIGKNHCFNQSFLDKWFDVVQEYHHWGKERGEMRPSDKAVYDWRHSDKRPMYANFAEKGGSTVLAEGLIDEAEPFPLEECMTFRIAEDAEAFLAEQGDKPFFLKYSFPDPHWPHTVCEPYYSMYSPEDIESLPGYHEIDWSTHPFKHFIQSMATGYDSYTEDERKKVLAIYYGMITFIDDAVGRLLDSLEKNGMMDNTLIMFTSDHGCFAGHFGLFGKTGGFYDSLIRIPLIVAGPGVNKGTTSDGMINNVDFVPTILDWLGMDTPDYSQGSSFSHLFTSPDDGHRSEIYAELGRLAAPPPPFPPSEYEKVNAERTAIGGWQWFIEYVCDGRSTMIKKDGWKYCCNHSDKEELYHTKEDPLELTNLIDDEDCRAIKDSLRVKLMEWLMVQPHQFPVASSDK
jgi:arylsulfatase A-like enzyme